MKLLRNKMEFSSAIYRGDPCPEFSFSFKFTFHKIRTTARDPDSKLPGSLFMGFYEILHHKLIKLFVFIPTRKLLHYIRRSDPS